MKQLWASFTRAKNIVCHWVYLIASISLTLLLIAVWLHVRQIYAQQQIEPFLEPPYYGTFRVNCVFDHDLPMAGDGNDHVIHYDGTQDGADPRNQYDEHRGIDYALRYELLRASAPGTVVQAGWASTNHRSSYGLHVRIDHNLDDDPEPEYRTIYGHMSVLRVQTGDEIPDGVNEFQRIIGISGNTGWCAGWEGTGQDNRCTDNDPPTCGAHLHFQLEEMVNGRPVNPYGWIGADDDPWAVYDSQGDGVIDGATSIDLWQHYPSITNGDVFTSGTALTAPPMAEEEGNFIIDNGDTDFATSPPEGWTLNNATGWDGDSLTRAVPGADCTATWNFPDNQPPGRYHVFINPNKG